VFSIFFYKNNAAGLFDKFILFVFGCVFILSGLFGALNYDETAFNILDIVSELLIWGRFIYDPKFKFIYLVGYNFVTRSFALMLGYVIGDAFIFYFLTSLSLIFFNAYFFQFFKLKSYKACDDSFELLN